MEAYIINKLQDIRRRGFTLPELMVVLPIALLVMGALFAFMTSLYIDNLKAVGRIQVINDVNRALNVASSDIVTGFSFSTALSSGVTDGSGPPGGGSWNGNASTPFSTLITRLPATTASASDPAKQIVRENQNGCGVNDILSNPIHYYNTIYFVNNGKLYRRTAIDQTPPALCGDVYQKHTCPVTSPTPGCATDVLLAEDVTEFKVRYETPKTGTSPNYSCPSGTTQSSAEDGLSVCLVSNPNNAVVVTVFLTITRKVGGQDFSYGHRFTIRPLNKDLPT